jgi:formylglycine-generating enzyme required for sulfatase activity
MRCNGNDYDFDPGMAGDQDGVLATGSLAQCYANWGSSSRIYDLSGNIEEWAQARSSGVNPIRGGSMNDTRRGIECDFDFVVANDSFQIPSVGFRCCRTSAP